jgi:uncharacterized protein (DUF2141 family)
MKNLTIIIYPLFIFLLFTSFNIKTDKTFSLTINVEKLRNSEGIVQFALYNKDGSIPDENYNKCYKILKANIVNGSSKVIFKDIPIGKYAINVFHDENNNGKIDKGFIMPIEGIGFSNFKTINITNRPSFVKASFMLQKNTIVNIPIIYM